MGNMCFFAHIHEPAANVDGPVGSAFTALEATQRGRGDDEQPQKISSPKCKHSGDNMMLDTLSCSGGAALLSKDLLIEAVEVTKKSAGSTQPLSVVAFSAESPLSAEETDDSMLWEGIRCQRHIGKGKR